MLNLSLVSYRSCRIAGVALINQHPFRHFDLPNIRNETDRDTIQNYDNDSGISNSHSDPALETKFLLARARLSLDVAGVNV